MEIHVFQGSRKSDYLLGLVVKTMIFEVVPRGPQGPSGSSGFSTTGPDLAIIAFSHDLSSLDFKNIKFFELGRLHALTHKGSGRIYPSIHI